MPICASEIDGNFEFDCNKRLTKGNTETMYLGNLADVTASVIDADGVVLSGFTLRPGAKLIKVEGFNLSNQSTLGFNKTDFAKFVPHSVIFRILSDSDETKKRVNRLLARSNYFAITKKKGRNGIFEAHGFNTGMDTDAFSRDSNADDNGAFNVTMTAGEETTVPYTVRHVTASVEDTQTWLDSLAYT